MAFLLHDSQCYRRFTRLSFCWTPSASCLQENISRIQAGTLQQVIRFLVQWAESRGLEREREIYIKCYMGRVTQAGKAERLNRAWLLPQDSPDVPQTVQRLSARFGLSSREAYRYLREVQRLTQPVPVSEGKQVLSVRLPRGLIRRLREHSAANTAVSELVRGPSALGSPPGSRMAEAGPLAVAFEYRFDRHLPDRLAGAYERLAPV